MLTDSDWTRRTTISRVEVTDWLDGRIPHVMVPSWTCRRTFDDITEIVRVKDEKTGIVSGLIRAEGAPRSGVGAGSYVDSLALMLVLYVGLCGAHSHVQFVKVGDVDFNNNNRPTSKLLHKVKVSRASIIDKHGIIAATGSVGFDDSYSHNGKAGTTFVSVVSVERLMMSVHD